MIPSLWKAKEKREKEWPWHCVESYRCLLANLLDISKIFQVNSAYLSWIICKPPLDFSWEKGIQAHVQFFTIWNFTKSDQYKQSQINLVSLMAQLTKIGRQTKQLKFHSMMTSKKFLHIGWKIDLKIGNDSTESD